MHLTGSTIATIVLVLTGVAFAVPVLSRGFRRRGRGVRYERSFLIQRAPQFTSLIDIALIVVSFVACNRLLCAGTPTLLLSAASLLAEPLAETLSWLGVAILLSGLVFMVGGWYSLGESFTTDAEILDKHCIRTNGLLKYVMHPAYSGIIQSLFGASLAALSPLALLFTVLAVAPLWLKRAKYEERLMIETFGQSYMDYAATVKWRRLIPPVIPIGV